MTLTAAEVEEARNDEDFFLAIVTGLEDGTGQGLPGTGKTYVTARAILALVRKGARVGVTSNIHEAIRNVLMGCLDALEDDDLPITLDLVHKTSGEDDGYPVDCAVRRTTSSDDAAGGQQVVGATAWFFASDENVQAFDWLFVDEAGQVGLANMVAMGRAARNIVLVGDQITQGRGGFDQRIDPDGGVAQHHVERRHSQHGDTWRVLDDVAQPVQPGLRPTCLRAPHRHDPFIGAGGGQRVHHSAQVGRAVGAPAARFCLGGRQDAMAVGPVRHRDRWFRADAAPPGEIDVRHHRQNSPTACRPGIPDTRASSGQGRQRWRVDRP